MNNYETFILREGNNWEDPAGVADVLRVLFWETYGNFPEDMHKKVEN